MTIRKPTELDIPALVALNKHVHSLHSDALPDTFKSEPNEGEVARSFSDMFNQSAYLWLLAEEVVPVGYLLAEFHDKPATCFRPARKFCDVCQIAVRPEARGRGAARAMLQAMRDNAEARGYPTIELTVWDFNIRAQAAFTRLGFSMLSHRMTLST